MKLDGDLAIPNSSMLETSCPMLHLALNDTFEESCSCRGASEACALWSSAKLAASMLGNCPHRA